MDFGCELVVMNVVDTISYAKTINSLRRLFPPAEILFPRTARESALGKALEAAFPDSEMVLVARKYFNESSGAAEVRRLMHDGSDEELCCRYLCMAAVAALLKYVEYSQRTVFASQSLRVKFLAGPPASMHVDMHTLKALDVMQCDGGAASLFAVVDHTQTSMGARMLRVNLCQPPNDVPTIAARQDCVEELCRTPASYDSVGQALKKLRGVDLDRLVGQLARVPKQLTRADSSSAAVDSATLAKIEANVACLLALRSLFVVLEALAAAVARCAQPLLHAMAGSLFDARLGAKILAAIDRHVDADTATAKASRIPKTTVLCFAVRTGIDGLLDVSRKTYLEANEDAQEHYDKLRADGGELGQELKLHRSKKRGFYLSLPSAVARPASALAIEVVRQAKTGWLFTTRTLASISERMKENEKEILVLTSRVLEALLDKVRKAIPWLNRCSEAVALLDMVWSLATYARLTDGCCRPTFCTDGVIAVRRGYHPVLYNKAPQTTVPNSAFLSSTRGGSNCLLVVGANNAGKTIYLASVCLLVIMAHVGSFVPAQVFRLSPLDSLHVQMGCEENLETNTSSFYAEMQQLAFIGSAAHGRSLVCFDELGKSTAVAEGRAIFQAAVEAVLDTSSLAVFVTHFDDLARALSKLYPGVRHVEMAASLGDDGQLVPSYRAQPQDAAAGLPDNYGIKLAVVAAFPYRVVQDALRIRAALADEQARPRRPEKCADVARQGRLVEEILERTDLDADDKLRLLAIMKKELAQ